jgi:putative transcriptional regulator
MVVKITLKQVREQRGLSQNKLAQSAGMTLQNLQKIEYGQAKSLTLQALDKLCATLNCQPGDLLQYQAGQNSPCDDRIEGEKN